MAEIPNLNAIDFSKPDGEFSLKTQIYQIKLYANAYFFRNKLYQGFDFIYAFRARGLPEDICDSYLTQKVEQITFEEFKYLVQRCVQYQDTIFQFGIDNGEYYSLRHDGWIDFNLKIPRYLSAYDILGKPLYFFIEQAEIAYYNQVDYIENEDSGDYFYADDATIPMEFICGSESELNRLTKIATVALKEFQSLFDKNSSIRIVYASENQYNFGGVNEISTDSWDGEIVLSKQAKQLFDMIFEHNYFTGIYWEYNDGPRGYTGYSHYPHSIEIEVQAPSQHERIEALLELQNWLEDKMPEEEIEALFK